MWSLPQEFLLGWVSFSIISAARIQESLSEQSGCLPGGLQHLRKDLVCGLWPGPVVLLTDLLVLDTKALDVSKDTLPCCSRSCQQTSSYYRLPGLQARLSLMDYGCAHEILGLEGDADQF